MPDDRSDPLTTGAERAASRLRTRRPSRHEDLPSDNIHKPLGLCGVSAGGFGGTRMIESLLPVMRELGLLTIFWDLKVSGVQRVFDTSGQLLDPMLPQRN
jgi:NAD(P)H-dependent FMN reductase